MVVCLSYATSNDDMFIPNVSLDPEPYSKLRAQYPEIEQQEVVQPSPRRRGDGYFFPSSVSPSSKDSSDKDSADTDSVTSDKCM